jgi:hypothetical protein
MPTPGNVSGTSSGGGGLASLLGPGGGALGGLLGSLLGGSGSTNTSNGSTSGNTSSNSSGSNTTNANSSSTPNLPDWYTQFLKGMIPQFQNASFNASKPLLGQPQQAQYNQGVNQGANQTQNNLLQMLAKHGALNSGRAATSATDISNFAQGQKNQYAAQMPVINQQNSQSQMAQLLGLQNNFKPPVVGQSNQSSSISDLIQQMLGQQNSTTTNTTHQGGTGLLGSIFG